MLEAALNDPGPRSPEGYAVARERADDHDRADLEWTDDATDPDRLLFVTPRGYPVRHNLFYKRTFKPAVKEALPERLHRLRFHDLRHTCAALSLATPGGNLQHVKERLGHENISTTVDSTGSRVPSVDAAMRRRPGRRACRPASPRQRLNPRPLP